MSRPKEPFPAKLMVGLIYKEKDEACSGWKAMEKKWGAIEILSKVRPFTYTRYYEQEMGQPLFRRWAFFEDLVPQDRLADIKKEALELEEPWQHQGKRCLNIDPGLITAERLVLSTGKNYSHRIYLGQGIFGDLTLIFHQGSFQPLPWTYPDYKDEEAIGLFNRIREKYLREISEGQFQSVE
ncbi:MAG: DUF4416 family protein [Thermodesulfobacteriota bacterium]